MSSRAPRWRLLDNRHVVNCKTALFPEFLHELRDGAGEAIGYLSTVPGYWCGDPNALQTFSYIDETLRFGPVKTAAVTGWYLLTREWLRSTWLFDRVAREVRASRMTDANAVYLISIVVAPERRGQKLPQMLVERAKSAARGLGYDYVVAPFRPSAYGQFKRDRRAEHSPALFEQYCGMTRADGLPADPWLRAVARIGARLLVPVERSFCVERSLSRFERLRREFKPTEWYSPAPDVWECGETCTWYVDRARRQVVSAEPNLWGAFYLRPDGDRPTPGSEA